MSSTSLEALPRTKRIFGTCFAVDCFHLGKINGCACYFLTHFHSDHYRGLSSTFSHGLIYCTSTTASLVQAVLRVTAEYLKVLELNIWYEIEACAIMLVDANHCPGACMIICKVLATGEVHLHCGDMRADPDFVQRLQSRLGGMRCSTVYLDTTYANPLYVFPRQQQVIDKTCALVSDTVNGKCDKQKRLIPLKWLVVTCSYMIGKERLAIQLSHILGCKIYVSSFKQKLIKCIRDEGFEHEAFTNDPNETMLHLGPMEITSKKEAEKYFQSYCKKFTHMLVVNPSGWNYNKQPSVAAQGVKWLVKERIGMISVPYSEHSSWEELVDFVQRIPCDFLIPTVGNYGQVLRVPKESPEKALWEWHQRCTEREESKAQQKQRDNL